MTAGLVKIDCLPVPAGLENDIKDWFCRQSRLYGLRWFLAHADDGVIWGESREAGLALSGDSFPEVSPPLRAVTLQQARLFGKEGELFLWQDGGDRRARLIRDGVGEEKEYYDEDQLLWGNKLECWKDGFALLRQGSEGLLHAPPLPEGAELPVRLKVRHYIDYDSDDGQAFIAFSRLVSLKY
ncbi:CRISPR-associated protein [Desulfotomaculum copahuensis]|uniref:CRISPR-associated protein n=2 Tax=Desulfotomaculum copahuensis TaxID=1838280 RepID=A0A1B7LJN2_9FIRM|nr:CRISPR-associated protein [Desulfotomaculum copahuensis]